MNTNTSCELPLEERYAFRKRLESAHQPGMRDHAAQPTPDELDIGAGFAIVLPDGAGEVAQSAAEDLADYLAVSMDVSPVPSVISAGAEVPDAADVRLGGRLDPTIGERTCRIEVADDGVSVTASDERSFARALYHLEDLMDLRGGPFLKKGVETRRAKFCPRMSHSGYDVDRFPDAHLAQMARHGFDAILVFVRDVGRAKHKGETDINDIIRRARRFGLDTYLYSYIVAFTHPDDADAAERFAATFGRVAAAYPEAKGIVLVGESCQFPSKDPRVWPHVEKLDGIKRPEGETRPQAGWFPCSDYPDWLRAVKAALESGNPNIETVFWSYNWGYQSDDLRLALIDAIPRDVTLQATFEMFEKHHKRNGFPTRTDDYTLSFPGPGHYFASEAAEAKRIGLRLYAMANSTGRTWDFGTAPYEPGPFLWKKRWDAVNAAQRDWGLSGLMENHHYGCLPTFISELAREAYTEGGIPFETHLRLIAARDFGEANIDAVLDVWREWSDALEDIVASDLNQYTFLRVGPSYPFNFTGEPIDPATYPTPECASNGNEIVFLNYPVYPVDNCWGKHDEDETVGLEIDLLRSSSERFIAGAERLRALAPGLSGRRREMALRQAGLGEYLGRTLLTGIHLKEAARIMRNGKDRAALCEIAASEYANALSARDLVARDSTLGFEVTMDYLGHLEQFDWKLERMRKLYGLMAWRRRHHLPLPSFVYRAEGGLRGPATSKLLR